MADTTQTIVNFDGMRRYDVTLTGICDGTGEADATKVDINPMTVHDGITSIDHPVTQLVVERIEWVVQGYTRIELTWDTSEDNFIAVIPGGGRDTNALTTGASAGCFEYGDVGLVDPSGEGGSIVMNTFGNVSGDTYQIRLCLRKKYSL